MQTTFCCVFKTPHWIVRKPLSSGKTALKQLKGTTRRNASTTSASLHVQTQRNLGEWDNVKWRLLFPCSEAWGPPQFQEKRSRSERAILGALGEFRGILGAAPGIGNSILGIRNSILGMASHDLINTKPTILGATLGAIPGIAANPPERFSFAPAFSERFFKNWGGPRAPDLFRR